MKRLFLVFFIIVCVCTLALTFAACKKADTQDTLVPMGDLRLENEHILCWDPVEGAVYYSLRVCFDSLNGYEIPVEGTSYMLKLFDEGTYTLYVRPVFSSSYGAYSAPLTYVVEKTVAVTPVDDGDNGTVVLRGTGTYEDPILIYTREELATLTDGKREVEENDETVKMQNYYRLMDDIDLGGKEWTPIGSSSKPFEGLFDGNGHTISGLTQTKLCGDSIKRNGLFSTLSKATVINLHLADIHMTLGLVSDKFCLGGLAGYSVNSTIENCSVDGTIDINSPQSGTQPAYVGLLLGYSNGTAIRRVSVDGRIDATFSTVFAGGISGITTAPELDYINDCLSKADVYATSTSTSGKCYAAGLTFISNTGSTANCVWLGHAAVTPMVGVPADEGNYGAGMFVCSINATTKSGGKRIYNTMLENCFFDIGGVEVDDETYAPDQYESHDLWLNAVADRYCVGCAEKQKRTSSVYAVDATTRADVSYYHWQEAGTECGLDFDNVWQMSADGPTLRAFTNRWYTVTFVVDSHTISTQHVLGGQTATMPVYVGENDVAVQWDFDPNTPIDQDTIVYEINQQ